MLLNVPKYYIFLHWIHNFFDSPITTCRVHPDNDCLNCLAYSHYPPKREDFGCLTCRKEASELYFCSLDLNFDDS